jgi:hypothetical protein
VRLRRDPFQHPETRLGQAVILRKLLPQTFSLPLSVKVAVGGLVLVGLFWAAIVWVQRLGTDYATKAELVDLKDEATARTASMQGKFQTIERHTLERSNRFNQGGPAGALAPQTDDDLRVEFCRLIVDGGRVRNADQPDAPLDHLPGIEKLSSPGIADELQSAGVFRSGVVLRETKAGKQRCYWVAAPLPAQDERPFFLVGSANLDILFSSLEKSARHLVLAWNGDGIIVSSSSPKALGQTVAEFDEHQTLFAKQAPLDRPLLKTLNEAYEQAYADERERSRRAPERNRADRLATFKLNGKLLFEGKHFLLLKEPLLYQEVELAEIFRKDPKWDQAVNGTLERANPDDWSTFGDYNPSLNRIRLRAKTDAELAAIRNAVENTARELGYHTRLSWKKPVTCRNYVPHMGRIVVDSRDQRSELTVFQGSCIEEIEQAISYDIAGGVLGTQMVVLLGVVAAVVYAFLFARKIGRRPGEERRRRREGIDDRGRWQTAGGWRLGSVECGASAADEPL